MDNSNGSAAEDQSTKLKREGPAVKERDGDGLYISWLDKK